MSQEVIDYNFTQDNDQISIREVRRVDVASGSVDAMATRALATVGVAIGATRYSSSVKCFSKSLNHVEGVIWDVTINWRTESLQDLIQNSASGTTVEKGFDAQSEHILRDRHPTSGVAYNLGSFYYSAYAYEPRLSCYFDKVHDSFSTIQAAATTIVGAINSATWNGYAPGTWLCKGAYTQTVRTETGDRYLTRYEFSYSPNAWGLARKAFTWNGVTVTGITAATVASGQFTIYRDANFNSYGFTL